MIRLYLSAFLCPILLYISGAMLSHHIEGAASDLLHCRIKTFSFYTCTQLSCSYTVTVCWTNYTRQDDFTKTHITVTFGYQYSEFYSFLLLYPVCKGTLSRFHKILFVFCVLRSISQSSCERRVWPTCPGQWPVTSRAQSAIMFTLREGCCSSPAGSWWWTSSLTASLLISYQVRPLPDCG